MIDTPRLILPQLQAIDFTGKGEAFIESRFLTPLLSCLGYEAHKDYEVIRHGDDGSAFKLRYPPVEKGAQRVKHYNPDYVPTIRKKMFWIIEAKSPTDVRYPFEAKYLVQPGRVPSTTLYMGSPGVFFWLAKCAREICAMLYARQP